MHNNNTNSHMMYVLQISIYYQNITNLLTHPSKMKKDYTQLLFCLIVLTDFNGMSTSLELFYA